MNLKQINKQYFLKKNMYDAVLSGISSNMISYRNGIMTIEVTLSNKWNKSYDSTAFQIAHDWKNSFDSLSNAIGCKVFIIDRRKNEITYTPGITTYGPMYHARKGILFRADLLN
jgi:hypothetical protein